MELEHSFTVPVAEDRAWDVLLDVERVAPCMPGATLQSVDGDVIHGSIKVKVGPISMTYKGTAQFTERDQAAHVITLAASGKDTRGAGTASATVRSMLEGKGDETHVVVHTTLNVTGKPAQFGRGVMAEVGGRLIGIFADNLAKMIAAEPVPAPAGESVGGDGLAAAETGAGAAGRAADGSGTAGSGSGTSGPAGSGSGTADLGTPGTEGSASGAAAAGTAEQDELLPIDVLNLGTRAWSSLRQAGIQTIGDLVKRTAQQLLAIDNIGPASIADIRRKLADRGLALAESAAGSNGASGGAAETAPAGDRTAAAAAAGTATSPEANGDHGAARPQQPSSAEVPTVTPLRAVPSQPSEWQPNDDAIDLLSVAGLPVLKRAVPAAAAVLALILVVLGVRRRRASRR